MAFPYDYDCECTEDGKYTALQGRQSEVLFNGEQHNIYESVKHLTDYFSNADTTPTAKHKGSLWYDQRNNMLYAWVGLGYKHDRVRNGWLPIATDKFQITDEILNDYPTANPVLGQLWLYNGTLLYWSGSNWEPVRTLEQIDSQFSMAAFDNFRLYSPLNRLGSAVVSDFELEALLALQKKYQNGEYNTDSAKMSKLIERWNIDIQADLQRIVDFDISDVFYQYLVPNMDVDRVFIDGKLDQNYVQQSKSIIQYKRSYLLDEQDNWDDSTPLTAHVKKPSLLHINAGQASKITKRIFKVDRANPKIMCPATNTEFYGYTINDTRGHFLIPTQKPEDELYEYQKLLDSVEEENKEYLKSKLKDLGYDLDSEFVTNTRNIDGDYMVQEDGIYLSYEASEQYDYVLAITYEFSWLNATGMMKHADNRKQSSAYYIPQKLGSINVFVNGLDYEDTYYSWDSSSKTLVVAEDTNKKNNFDVSVLGVYAHEYGYIRSMNLALDNQSARINTIRRFNKPLIFVNGEVLTRSSWQYFDTNLLVDTPRPGTSFTLYGIRRDMAWTIMDMQRTEYTYDENGAVLSTEVKDICIEDDGIVQNTSDFVDSYGNRAIPVPSSVKIQYERSDNYKYKKPFVVLFVNGLMVKREDVYYDITKHTITCEGLQPGMTYVLLNDSERQLWTEDNGVMPALTVGKIDNSLVYRNGFLLNEPESYLYHGEPGFAAVTAKHGEIRAFNGGEDWKVFNATKADTKKGTYGVWEVATSNTAAEVKSFSDSYTNAVTTISFNQSLNITASDEIVIFGFKLANYVESLTTPVTCWLHQNDLGALFIKEAGYSDEYIALVEDENNDSVYLSKLDPSNPKVMVDYKANNNRYYQFLFKAYQAWEQDSGLSTNTGLTFKQKVEKYREAAKQPNGSNTLPGYFYDNVYMRTKSDEESYISIRDLARGILWCNKVFIGKEYNPQTDYIMVWINGVRQYPIEDYVIEPVFENNIVKGYEIVLGHYEDAQLVHTVDQQGYVQMPRGSGIGGDIVGIDKEPLTGMLTYIIQHAEKGAQRVCRYTILDHKNCVRGTQNIYTTRDLDPQHVDPVSFERDTSYDFSLYPGNVTIYADGIRLPKENYRIIDNYTILINSEAPFIGSKDTYPTQEIIDVNGNRQTIRHLQPERLLIEVREDAQWVERNTKINTNFNGDFYVFSTENNLPATILDTQDTILIFVDGLYHGLTQNDGYVIDKTLGAIVLKDSSVYNVLKTNELETYLAQQEDISDYYKRELAAYRQRSDKRTHIITFEWR